MHQLLTAFAGMVVVTAAMWLIGLAVVAVARPKSVENFFGKFASSAFSHFLEMFLRLLVGASFVFYSPQMKFAVVFTAFGWLLIATTAVLVFVPWQTHRKFAERSLPMMYKWMTFFGIASLLGGAIVLYSIAFGSVS